MEVLLLVVGLQSLRRHRRPRLLRRRPQQPAGAGGHRQGRAHAYRLQPGLDTLTIFPGVLSSYPNFMFNIPAADVEAFVEAMEQSKDQKSFEAIVERWGVRRSNPQFWQYFHDIGEYINETDPVEAGVLDMNRYENL